MSYIVDDFNDFRTRMNTKILDSDNLVLKRLFNLDANTYSPGALDAKTQGMWALQPCWCCAAMIV